MNVLDILLYTICVSSIGKTCGTLYLLHLCVMKYIMYICNIMYMYMPWRWPKCIGVLAMACTHNIDVLWIVSVIIISGKLVDTSIA